MPHSERVARDCMGRELVKVQIREGNPLNASLVDRRHLLTTQAYKSSTGEVSLHKGNTWLETERSRHFNVAIQTTHAEQISSTMQAIDMMRYMNYPTLLPYP